MSFFHFLKFVMNFLKGVVSICHSFRNTGQPGLINGSDRCFQAFKLSIDVHSAPSNLAKQKQSNLPLPKRLRKLWIVKALSKRRSIHAPNLTDEVSTAEERRLNQCGSAD